jgi:hypothetical protein
MEEKDEYIVYINDYKTRYYYKNGKLHREAGPAVVRGSHIENYQGLVDKYPYKEILLHTYEAPKGYESQDLQYEDNLSWYTAMYYLEGKPYSQKEFEKIKLALDLNNELSSELASNQSNHKKSKI